MRFSWHPTKRTVVVSQWRNGVCVASTRLELSALAPIITFFARALHDAADSTDSYGDQPPAAGPVRTPLAIAVARWIRRSRSLLAARFRRRDRDEPRATPFVGDGTIADRQSA